MVRATPVPMSLAAAGQRYLQVTRPYNVALERFEKAANNGSSVATLRARARAVAAANLAESSNSWPSPGRRRSPSRSEPWPRPTPPRARTG